ncbi:MAG: PqqD family protein [candidate division KSB1 bacterium]|nr:PqqD family protein [candidate division KSB1 bacterium]MDZ7335389.1 PqqD family protein [candidate division KSB1 bacterium]MDZ7356431.1 PqqD family protein [candidate division KSB1 bacterium]MDZ7401202.1 PqqD family protein [candidate division KSB1 bacterium]
MKANLFDQIPEPTIQFEELEDGTIILIQPKFTNKWLMRYILPRLSKPNFRIKLDSFGSFVWKLINGQNTVEQIANLFQARFKGEIASVHERVALFVQMLARHGFIRYKNDANGSAN